MMSPLQQRMQNIEAHVLQQHKDIIELQSILTSTLTLCEGLTQLVTSLCADFEARQKQEIHTHERRSTPSKVLAPVAEYENETE